MDVFKQLTELIDFKILEKFIFLDDTASARLEKELSYIEQGGLTDQFLINHRIVEICDRLGILRSPGVGSTASWFVNYCLGICKQNPIKENYYFEQFFVPGLLDFIPFFFNVS